MDAIFQGSVSFEYVFFEVVPFLDRLTYSKNKDMVSV